MTLLEKHQAIIDAWFANWLKQERKRIEALRIPVSAGERQ